MSVTFAHYGEEIASSRLRALIPQKELEKLGVPKGKDVLVYGKHHVTPQQISHFGKTIYDICDDHFNTPEIKDYYLRNALSADCITCNSEVMRCIIKERTGRDAIVIKEPYEAEEGEPDIGEYLFWYGHKSNLQDLKRLGHLDYPMLVMSNADDTCPWTIENFREAISHPCVVIIPTGKSLAKSENRMVEAIRNGRYVCAEYLPAYEPFHQFFPLGNIKNHLEIALENPEQSIELIRAAQDYIRDRYSPRTIAEQWLEVIHGACKLQ